MARKSREARIHPDQMHFPEDLGQTAVAPVAELKQNPDGIAESDPFRQQKYFIKALEEFARAGRLRRQTDAMDKRLEAIGEYNNVRSRTGWDIAEKSQAVKDERSKNEPIVLAKYYYGKALNMDVELSRDEHTGRLSLTWGGSPEPGMEFVTYFAGQSTQYGESNLLGVENCEQDIQNIQTEIQEATAKEAA